MTEAERLADPTLKAWKREDELRAELRRLSAINAELVELVKNVLVEDESMQFMGSDWHQKSMEMISK